MVLYFWYYFFYPAYPRTFKNLEIVLDAARELEASGFCEFEIWLTVDGTVNRYAESIVRRYGDVRSVRWLGLLSRDEVFQRYGEADCLLFPSKLESWGLPITEFKTTGKPILAADLPYAHETVGDYGRAAFFTATDSSALAQLMKSAAVGADVFRATAASPIAPLFAKDWAALWRILLESRVAERSTLLPEPTVIERIEH